VLTLTRTGVRRWGVKGGRSFNQERGKGGAGKPRISIWGADEVAQGLIALIKKKGFSRGGGRVENL